MLQVKDLTVKIGDLTIVDHLNFTLAENQWLMLVGPNGAGKSTVVNAVSQGMAYTGTVLYEGKDVKRYKPVELARKLGVLSQQHQVGYSFSVEEVVRLGRYSYSPGIFKNKTDTDNDMVEEALRITGLSDLREQSVLTLSGGELQRTFLAQLLAQDPKLLILDEPANHLDLIYQKQVFSLIREWMQKPGRAVMAVVHDLSLARMFGTHALLMDHGKRIAHGSIDEALKPENLDTVYGMSVSGWMREMLSQWKEEK